MRRLRRHHAGGQAEKRGEMKQADTHTRAQAVVELALMLPDFATFYCDRMNRLDLWPEKKAQTPHQMMVDFAWIAEEVQCGKMDWTGGSYYRIGVEQNGQDWDSFARFEDEMGCPWVPEESDIRKD